MGNPNRLNQGWTVRFTTQRDEGSNRDSGEEQRAFDEGASVSTADGSGGHPLSTVHFPVSRPVAMLTCSTLLLITD
ncbi:hypothetical protein R6Q59_030549 [Mikania micrantha]